MQPHGGDLPDRLRWQAVGCDRLGSPLYGTLLRRVADDVAAGGAFRELLWPYRDEPGRRALALRLLACVHRWVLRGELPELAAHYPSAGGKLPPGSAWPWFWRACVERAAQLRQGLERPVQTNEVGRCAALLGGFLLVAEETGMPLRLLELGASAGLNLRWDHYRSFRWLAAMFEVPPPRVDAPVAVAERRGCDPEPLDPASEEGALTLRSFVWPEMLDRLAMLEEAIEVCRHVPADVDRADGGAWLPERLAERRPGVATVVFHSAVTQYPGEDSLARMGAALQRAAVGATPAAPLAWLRFEPSRRQFEVRLSLWPGGDDRLLAVASGHGRRVRWLG